MPYWRSVAIQQLSGRSLHARMTPVHRVTADISRFGRSRFVELKMSRTPLNATSTATLSGPSDTTKRLIHSTGEATFVLEATPHRRGPVVHPVDRVPDRAASRRSPRTASLQPGSLTPPFTPSRDTANQRSVRTTENFVRLSFSSGGALAPSPLSWSLVRRQPRQPGEVPHPS